MPEFSGRTGKVILYVISLAIIVACLVPVTSIIRNQVTLRSTGYLWTGPYMIVEVSPPGYPPIGEYWSIRVFVVNRTSEGIVFQRLSNVTILAVALVDDITKNYELNVDTNGETSMQFQSGCSDIAFQAISAELPPSEKVIITDHYVPASAIDSLLSFNAFSALGLLIANFAVFERKGWKSPRMGILWKFWMASIVCFFSITFFVSLYTKIFLWSQWGYPENIVDGFITITYLNYVFYFGVILLFVFVLYTLIMKGKTDVKQI